VDKPVGKDNQRQNDNSDNDAHYDDWQLRFCNHYKQASAVG